MHSRTRRTSALASRPGMHAHAAAANAASVATNTNALIFTPPEEMLKITPWTGHPRPASRESANSASSLACNAGENSASVTSNAGFLRCVAALYRYVERA